MTCGLDDPGCVVSLALLEHGSKLEDGTPREARSGAGHREQTITKLAGHLDALGALSADEDGHVDGASSGVTVGMDHAQDSAFPLHFLAPQ